MSSYAATTPSGAALLCGNKRPFSATQTPMLHPMGVDGVNGMVADPTQKRSPLLCGYPSKKCWSWRVEKRNGELHKFCEYHRQKANTNQRRMEQRRKVSRTPAKGENAKSDGQGEGNSQKESAVESTTSIKTESAPSTPVKTPPSINTAMANAEKAASKKSGISYDCSTPAGSPRGIDHFDSINVPPASFTWAEVDLDIGMDAAVEYMMIDHAIDAEPSDKAVDLYEEDLYFLEHFIMEITTSGI